MPGLVAQMGTGKAFSIGVRESASDITIKVKIGLADLLKNYHSEHQFEGSLRSVKKICGCIVENTGHNSHTNIGN